MGRLVRAVRGALARPVVVALLLSALVWYALSMVAVYRLAGRYHALGFGVGVVVFWVSLLVLVRRLMATVPPAWLRPLVDRWEGFACLTVLNLIIVNALAPYLRQLSQVRVRNPVVQNGFALAGQVTSRVLVGLFVAGVVALVCVMALRLYDGAARRFPPLARAGRILEGAALVAVGAYCLYAVLLTYNGGLYRSRLREHDSVVLASYEVERPFGFPWLWFVDLQSWRQPGGVERVLVFPGTDDLVAGQVVAGQPVRVAVRTGLFGIPRIERIRVDRDRDLEALVADIPAAWQARRRLTERLVAQGRWHEVIQQVHAHARYYPYHGEYYVGTLAMLRRAGRPQEADLVQQYIDQSIAAYRAEEARRAANGNGPEARPADVGAEARALATEVVALAGLDRHLAHAAQQAEATYGRWRWWVTDGERLGAVIRSAYRPQALVETATRRLAARLDSPEARDAVTWLRSPLSRRVLEIETAARTVASQKAAQELLATLPEAPPESTRLGLLRRLGRAEGVTYLAVALTGALNRGVLRAVRPSLSPEVRRWADDEPDVETLLARVEWTAFDTMVTLLTTYRALADLELDELVRFLESPSGAWFSAAYRDALLTALEAGGERAYAAVDPRRHRK